MVTPYMFGRATWIKVAQTPGISSAPTSFWDSWMNPPTPAASSGAPTSSPYINALDRWYNPWTKQTNYEAGEQGLMRAGQTAMGVGAGAATLAGGIAAAPAVAAGAQQVGAGLAAAGTAVGTQANRIGDAVSNAGARIAPALQRGSQIAGRAGENLLNRGQQAAYTYQNSIEPAMKRVGYNPINLGEDAMAVATGNFDKVKGPNWTGGMSPLSGGTSLTGLPVGSGAPGTGLPKPLEFAKNLYGATTDVSTRGLKTLGMGGL